MFRNLIAVCFLISMALVSSNAEPCQKCNGEEAHEEMKFTLTTQKSSWINKAVGEVLQCLHWQDTSTIEVKYHPTRTHRNWSGNNNHKFEKVNSWWKPNEWFTITEMLEHDKVNNRIHVQIHGMTNRWIYYLEHDAAEFIELLRTEENTVNLGHKFQKYFGKEPIIAGRVEGLPAKEDLSKRGDADANNGEGVYGFRVAINKTECPLGDAGRAVFGDAIQKWSSVREFFDAVSVRVHLKDNKVDYIEIPNAFRNLQANITNIDCFKSDKTTVALRLKDKPGYRAKNISLRSAADRSLYLGGDSEDTIAMEGKKLLKFLVDHAGDYANKITDDSNFTNFVAEINADWDPRPANGQSGNSGASAGQPGRDGQSGGGYGDGANRRRLTNHRVIDRLLRAEESLSR